VSETIGRFMVARKVTQGWAICNKRSNNLLGLVVGYTPWKTFVFRPKEPAEFSPDCLQDLAHFMFELKTEWLARGGPA
jgi:hypothetical protein